MRSASNFFLNTTHFLPSGAIFFQTRLAESKSEQFSKITRPELPLQPITHGRHKTGAARADVCF